MNKTIRFLLCLSTFSLHCTPINLTPFQKTNIGNLIWHNECGKSVTKLTFWNPHEPFPSFGIGHFIWFPKDYDGPFTQTFPDLIAFLKHKKVTLPDWLAHATHCPWNNRETFMHEFHEPRLTELRALLQQTIVHQTDFIIQNLQKALPAILKAAPRAKRHHIKKQFYTLAQSQNGMYALIDYCNFKGMGTNPNEQYQGHGWGLRYVLQIMNKDADDSVKEFIACAKKVLSERVEHAPEGKNEKRFLHGWFNRLETYLS